MLLLVSGQSGGGASASAAKGAGTSPVPPAWTGDLATVRIAAVPTIDKVAMEETGCYIVFKELGEPLELHLFEKQEACQVCAPPIAVCTHPPCRPNGVLLTPDR
jgi:hypothetical protein